MDDATATFRGIVHGKIIALTEDAGLPDGQEVDVSVRAVADSSLQPGEGLRQSFGAWADEGPEFDDYLRACRQENSLDRPELEP